MSSIVKISANKSVVVVPKNNAGTIARLAGLTIGQLSAYTIKQLGSL